jgi:Fe-S-cluster containining protein
MSESEKRTILPETGLPLGPSYALHDHQLTYFPELRVGEEIFSTRFTRSCSMASCSARCCRDGVLVDIAHRDRILSEAALVVQFMEPEQEHDPSRWFFEEEEIDEDFPSGRVVNTTSTESCVFLDSQKRCVLQRAETVSPGLKPFYCRAYPIAIDHARVTLDADWCPEETNCCGPVPEGEQTAFDVCGWELAFLLGDAGFDELRRLANDRSTLNGTAE